MSCRPIEHFSGLMERADAFLIDQFGTIHDGEEPYPEAIEALRALRAAGKRVILLSNSGRRASTNERRLAALGFTRDCYDASLCSGEVGWRALRADPPLPLRRSCRVLLFARGRSLDILEGFDVKATEDPAAADLVMIAGSEADRCGYDALWWRLRPAAERGLQAVCTNPDRVMMVGGALYPGPGQLAGAYHDAGGPVRWYGKPYADIYGAALELLEGIPRQRIFAVGDSIENDIAGAAAVGCKGVLVRTGILARASAAELEAEMIRCRARPDAIWPAFALEGCGSRR
ncbi:MAG: TIGR01459 family HAD-type hydrolase [Acetobacteraceae bacterium]